MSSYDGEIAGTRIKEGLVALADAMKYVIDRYIKFKIGAL